MYVTVATPAYNRAHLLPRLYESLCHQSCKQFEWIVVDDGSSDDTEETVQRFIAEMRISVRYIRKKNGGKHTAVNLAAEKAEGELFFIADSDDWLPASAIADVIDAYSKVQDNQIIAGICGLDSYANGTLVGSGLPKDEIDATPQEIRCKWGVRGDMKEVYRTSVIREFPFPEIMGEKFCPEALVWNRIGRHYQLRYINKPIYIVEYQPDGITSSITRARMNSPIATMATYSEWFSDAIPFAQKVKMALNYWRFRFCSRKAGVGIASWGNLLAPLGFLLFIKDHMKNGTISDSMAFFGLKGGSINW